MALTMIFDATQMYHRYVLEPQSPIPMARRLVGSPYQRSLARGDFVPAADPGNGIVALGEEEPRQLFTRHGIFNH